MAERTGLTWLTPPAPLAGAVDEYGDKVLDAVTAVAGYIATQMQNDARRSAPWTDRTGNARSGLFGSAERDVAQRLVTIYLSHGVAIDYGVYLELAHGGAYAIVMRTVEAHLPELNRLLQDIFA